MLIDAAEDDDYYKIKTTLDKYNVKRINALVATHPHADHIGAMDDIIKSFDVDAIYMTSFGDDTKVIEDLMDAVESMGVPKIFINTGMQFQLGKASVSVLGPEEGEPKEDANNESIVMMVSYGETDFLLTGDMEEKESYEILERWGKNVDCEILKVAHHGSRTGTTKAFLDAATPPNRDHFMWEKQPVRSSGRENACPFGGSRRPYAAHRPAGRYRDTDGRIDRSGVRTVRTLTPAGKILIDSGFLACPPSSLNRGLCTEASPDGRCGEDERRKIFFFKKGGAVHLFCASHGF